MVTDHWLSHLSLKMMVSPRSSVTASKVSVGSHLLGASGFGFTFLWFGFGPEEVANIILTINGFGFFFLCLHVCVEHSESP